MHEVVKSTLVGESMIASTLRYCICFALLPHIGVDLCKTSYYHRLLQQKAEGYRNVPMIAVQGHMATKASNLAHEMSENQSTDEWRNATGVTPMFDTLLTGSDAVLHVRLLAQEAHSTAPRIRVWKG